MKTFKKYILGGALLSAAVLTGCKDKMRELNTDPDVISSALPEYQFLGATHNWGRWGDGWALEMQSGLGSTMQTAVYWGGSGTYVNPADWKGGGVNYYMDNFYYSRYYSSGKNLNSLVAYIDSELEPVDRPKYQDIRAIARLLQTHEAWVIFTNYGSMVYSEAFKVREGVKFPSYDIYNSETAIYKSLDDTMKMCIAQLSTPKLSEAVALGAYDGFYGYEYQTKETGGAMYEIVSADVERDRWLKFATTVRLKMALSMRNKDNEFYKKVLAEVRQQVTENPKALMSEVQDGCQYTLPDTWYGRGYSDRLSFWYGAPLSLVNSLNVLDDPRRPLMINLNYCDTSLNLGYKFIATYWKDSLETKNVYDELTKTWTRKSWGDRLKMGNVFQGHTSNPGNDGKPFGPGTLIRGRDVSITVHHPEWQDPNQTGLSEAEKKAREEQNATLTGVSLPNAFTGVTERVAYDLSAKEADRYKVFENGSRTVNFRVASGLQSRNFVTNTGSGGWTGPSWDYDNDQPSASEIKLVVKVLPYAEHCFMMSLICHLDGGSIGSMDAQGWYEEGIKAAMTEIVADAERVFVKICTNPNFPTVANVNADADGSNKRLYKIDQGMIDTYLANPHVQLTGSDADKINKIMIQMWFSLWQKTESLWYYYKVTGYPRTVKYNWETSLERDLPQVPGFEQPYNASGDQMLWPRIVITPQPQTENMPKWYEMQSILQAQTDPAYAPHGWDDRSGRVFWDVNQPAGLTN